MFDNMEEIITELKNKKLIDSNNRVIRWPKKQIEKELVLNYMSSKIEKEKYYTEAEINKIILLWQDFDDYALTRREMYDRYFINRTRDCKKYWKE